MLKNQRVKVNEPNYYGCTPLRDAAYYGQIDVIKWWIASGREMGLGKPGDPGKTDAIGGAKKEIESFYDEAKKKSKTKVATLLERFKSDAAKTRSAAPL